MNHKRGRPKNRRAGCLLCKPHKANGFNKHEKLGGVGGFSKIRREHHTKQDQREHFKSS